MMFKVEEYERTWIVNIYDDEKLKLIGVRNIIMMIMNGTVAVQPLKLIKYLYKHNFKYETKPIKWMCSEQHQQQKRCNLFSRGRAGGEM